MSLELYIWFVSCLTVNVTLTVWTYTTDTVPRTCLGDGVDSLSNSHSDGDFLEFFVKSDEELREHGGNDPVKHPVVLAQDDWITRSASANKKECSTCDPHFLASVKDTRTDSNPAIAVLLIT